MYEQHFGLSGHPFATTPDPDFYFDSHGHRRAYAYLRYAVLEGESFIVMTGDIGVGKTTLVHKLLRGLESEAIVTALLSSSRLDARSLLAAVLAAFRAPGVGQSIDELRAGLQAFLGMLTSTGRRALVVVDEAQHMLPDALEELTSMAKLQSRSGAPLQVLLSGQPELRKTLQSTSAYTMRQPVFLFCDIGLLSPAETRSYIEHRLRRVQWDESPSFSDEAHERIHRATDGVPRRINRLCDRLLMAACLREIDTISAELVDETNAELQDEMGQAVAAPVAVTAEATAPSAPAARAVAAPSVAPDIIPTLYTAVERVNGHAADRSTKRAEAPLLKSEVPAVQEPARPPPAARADDFEFVNKIRNASSGPPWAILAAAVFLFVLLIGAWAYQHERATSLAVAPGVAPGSLGDSAETARDAARTAELAEHAPGAIGPPANPPTNAIARPSAGPTTSRPPVRSVPAAPPARTAAERPFPQIALPTVAPDVAPRAEPEPPPVAAPCTAAVAALGLCSPAKNQ